MKVRRTRLTHPNLIINVFVLLFGTIIQIIIFFLTNIHAGRYYYGCKSKASYNIMRIKYKFSFICYRRLFELYVLMYHNIIIMHLYIIL